jgi:hypothetical protein
LTTRVRLDHYQIAHWLVRKKPLRDLPETIQQLQFENDYDLRLMSRRRQYRQEVLTLAVQESMMTGSSIDLDDLVDTVTASFLDLEDESGNAKTVNEVIVDVHWAKNQQNVWRWTQRLNRWVDRLIDNARSMDILPTGDDEDGAAEEDDE